MKYFNEIRNVALFNGILDEDLKALLSCLHAAIRLLKKEEYVWLEGDKATVVGAVLKGSVQIVKDDVMGNRIVIGEAAAGSLFGEAFTCARERELSVSVYAPQGGIVMLLDYEKIITTCSPGCAFHSRLIENMIYILARKNLQLMQKIEHTSRRTTREKLLSYLSDVSKKQGSRTFEIPFDRQALADYLGVDRSAMSSELSKLRDEGVLRYKKNHFVFL